MDRNARVSESFTADKRKKFEFVVLYGAGPNYIPSLPPSQQPLAGHAAYIESLRQQGALLAGGPFGDTASFPDSRHGPPLLSARDEAEARALVAQDPAVLGGVLLADVRQWDIRFGTNIPL